MMGNPASGSQTVFGFRRELAQGIPDLSAAMIFSKAVLPASLGLKRPESPSGEVNPRGYTEPGLPGPIGTAQDFAMLMTAAAMLEVYENVFGFVDKEELEDGVFRYRFEQDSERAVGSLEGVWALPPTDAKGRLYGLKVDSINTDIGNNTGIAARLALKAVHGTRMDHPVAGAANTGIYPGPVLRGLMALRPFAPVHIRIERDVAGGGLRYQVEQTRDVPTFPGLPIEMAYDADGDPTWQNLQIAVRLSGAVTVNPGGLVVTGTGTRFLTELEEGLYVSIAGENLRVESIDNDQTLTLAVPHTSGAADAAAHLLNRDAGYWYENYDPLEIIFPGSVADARVGDFWTFAEPGAWPNPVPTFLSGQRFTSAHWQLSYRLLGETAWRNLSVQSGQRVIAWPTSVDQGNDSKYPASLDRDGEPLTSGNFAQKMRGTAFLELEEAHRRFALRYAFIGRQLGTGQYRESVTENYPSASITDRTASVQGPGPVIETINWQAETNKQTGEAPVYVEVVTDRDWEPLA